MKKNIGIPSGQDSASISETSGQLSQPSQAPDGYTLWRNSLPAALQSDVDYDLEAFYNSDNGQTVLSEGQHLPDTYKRPNHPTFSSGSIHSNEETPGGEWFQDADKNWVFRPTEWNVQNAGGIENLAEYFRQNDPNAILATPDGDIAYMPDGTSDQTPLKFGESVVNSLKNVATRLKGFDDRATVLSAGIWENILGKELADAFYENDPIRALFGRSENAAEATQASYNEIERLASEYQPTEGVLDNIEKGNFIGLLAGVIDATSSLASSAIVSAPTLGGGLFVDMAGESVAEFNREKAKNLGVSVEQLYESGDAELLVPGTLGVAGAALERVGLKGVKSAITKNLNSSIGRAIVNVAGDLNKEGMTEWLQTGLEGANVAAAKEGATASDMAESFASSLFSREGLEAYIAGLAGAAGGAGLGRVARKIVSPANRETVLLAQEQMDSLNEALDNENVSPAAREALQQEVAAVVPEVAEAIENDAEVVQLMTPEQRNQAEGLMGRLDGLQAIINDPNVPESAKETARTQAEQVSAELDGIIANMQGPVETESQSTSETEVVDTPTADSQSIQPETEEASAPDQVTELAATPSAQESEVSPETTESQRLQSSYDRLTEGMTPEQIDADPDLVRMRDRIGQLSEIQPQENVTTTEETVTEKRPMSSFSNYGEYIQHLSETETDPDIIANEYNNIHYGEPDYIEQGIMDYLGRSRINKRDLQRYGDLGLYDKDLLSRWSDSKNKQRGLDQMAQELSDQLGVEVSPSEFIDFTLKYKGKHDFAANQTTREQTLLKDRYKELTGRNLTPEIAARVRERMAGNITDEQLAASNVGLQELGITYQDILDYEEYNRQTDGSAESVLPTNNEGRRTKTIREDQTAQIEQQTTVEQTQKKTQDSDQVESITTPETQPEALEEVSGEQEARVRTSFIETLRDDTKRSERKTELASRLRGFIESQKNIGIAQDGKQSAKADLDFYRDLVEYAAISIVDGAITTAQQLADSLGIPNTRQVREAFTEAQAGVNANTDLVDTSIKKRELRAKAQAYGFTAPLEPEVKPTEKSFKEASKAIEAGYDFDGLFNRIEDGRAINDTETAILLNYVATKESELINVEDKIDSSSNLSPEGFQKLADQRGRIRDELFKAMRAAELSGRITGRALRIRRESLLRNDSLAGMIEAKRKAVGTSRLTEKQYQKIREQHKELTRLKNALEKKNKQLEAEIQKLREQGLTDAEAQRQIKKNRRSVKRSEILEERAKLKTDLVGLFNNILSKKTNFAYDPESSASDDIKLGKVLKDLVANYLEEGKLRGAEIIDDIWDSVKENVPGLTKRDIRDAVLDSKDSGKPLLSDLQKAKRDFRIEMQLINKIEDLEAGIKKTKDPDIRETEEQRITDLRARLKELQDMHNPKMDPEQRRLENYKKRLEKSTEEVDRRLKDKDYVKPTRTHLQRDAEATRLLKEYHKKKHDFDVEVAKDKLRHLEGINKYVQYAVSYLGLSRSLMATLDFSAPLRQGVFVLGSRPIMSFNAAREMFGQAFSEERYQQWQQDLKDSPGYDLMIESGLDISDPTNPDAVAREEIFQSNLADKIGLVRGSTRAYAGYLNKIRVDLFEHGVNLLLEDGINHIDNPKAYKALAGYVNAATGRANLPSFLKNNGPLLSTLFFAPRLMVSRLQFLTNLANPYFWKNTPWAVKKMYFRDAGAFIGFGASMLFLTGLYASSFDDDDEGDKIQVGTDPTSSDFGKIRVGDTRYDIWGGAQQYVVLFSRIVSGKMTSSTGKVTELDGTSYTKADRATPLGRFMRGKLSPWAGFVTDSYLGSDFMGQPFDIADPVDLGGKLIEMHVPLVFGDLYDSWLERSSEIKKIDTTFGEIPYGTGSGAVSAVVRTGIPATFGLGVQTYRANTWLTKGVDTKSINLLNEKREIAMEPDQRSIKVLDIESGESRSMTNEEYKRYFDKWSSSLRNDLEANYDQYKSMSKDQFKKKFDSTKRRATSEAKEMIQGFSPEEASLSRSGTTYRLTPAQIKRRNQMNQQYINENRHKIYTNADKLQGSGKSRRAAIDEATRKMKSEANTKSGEQFWQMHKNGDIKLQVKED